MEDRISAIQERLRKNGLRLTKQRQVIFEVLLENSDRHLSVEELYHSVSEHDPDVGLATIYRTLEIFVKLNICHRMEFGGKGARYELSDGDKEHYHHHLFCSNCGLIIEVNDDLLDSIESKIINEHHFLIKDHSLRFYGLCQDCQLLLNNESED